ncbi:MAG: lamin tail domain-containing protein [Anaerococcus sp.]|uniref:lamin tail domain-containing protein n=1 Tax=Anaerococcus TaxID=165779 RepID=UPI002355EFBB|nr:MULTISPECIES: lamin tail domain-containing protein [Anaerococcus]MDU4025765.1 lamin tail domain-containing protein [Anaerococcus sp.]
MNKLLAVILATSLIFGANESFASEEIEKENTNDIQQIAENLEESATDLENARLLVGNESNTNQYDTNIVINEIMTKDPNKGPDYVELFNKGNEVVDLTGWYIFDDEDRSDKVIKLDGVVLNPGEVFVLEENNHFAFGLGKDDQVRLFNANGDLIDSYVWSGSHPKEVFARNPLTGQMEEAKASKGKINPVSKKEESPKEENSESSQSPYKNNVVINEIESKDPSGGNDYAEIYNNTDKAIDISGWYILDNDPKHKKDPAYLVKEGTSVPAKGFFVFEENVDFNFGLGGDDEVNLYDKDDKLVDKFAWKSHANGTYARIPDGRGDFVDGKATKGKSNAIQEQTEKEINVETINWPGIDEVKVLDETSIFDLKDLSGLDSHDGWIYGVNNKEGRFVIFKVVNDQVIFAPGFDNKGKAVKFIKDANNPKAIGPDSEGITVDSKGRVYLAVERDNGEKNINKNMILQVADPFKDKKEMVADKEWNITNLLPDVDANLGIETIEWVSFDNLNGLLYDQKNNKALDKNDYPNAYANGIFFVGLEANGHVYALVLEEDGKAEVISEIETGLGGVMSMDFDLENNVLWANADNDYNNIHNIIQFNGSKIPKIVHVKAPKDMNIDLNNEGFMIDPEVSEDGLRPTYWFMDGKNSKAFRKSAIKADYLKELGLTKLSGKESPINKESKKPATEDEQILIPPFTTITDKEEIENHYSKEFSEISSSRKEPYAEKITEEIIYVSKGYNTIKEGYYYKKDLVAKSNKLKKSVEKNRITAKAIEILKDLTPNIAAKNKEKIAKLLETSLKLQEKGQKTLQEIDLILAGK